MKVKVNEKSVIITEYNCINEGEVGVNVCEFDLPECFSGLMVTAAFNNLPVPVNGNICCVPPLKKGTVTLGVYAYSEDENGVTLMYSPKSTVFYVGEGSYSEDIGVEFTPTITEFEQYCQGLLSETRQIVEGFEKTENKVTVIDELSSDAQFPSAKAVYDFVESEVSEGFEKALTARRHYNTFSVLGDSYSTFVDFVNPENNLCWYPAGNPSATGLNNDVSKVEHMWWHIFASKYESALQVNNAYSGAPISYNGWGAGETDSAQTGFIGRANNIGKPELIFVFGGTNDSWVGVSIGEYKYSDWTQEDFVSFRPSLAYLLNFLKQHNAGAKIVFILNDNLKNEIDESVLTICNYYGVEVVELKNISKSNGHPTIAGQQSIAQQVYDFITSTKVTGISAAISKTNFATGITLNDLKPYLTVTATYDDGTAEDVTDYLLSGSVNEGNNIITISYGAYSTTVEIVVSQIELTSISATLSQTEFNMGATLDNIKPYLTVTGHYADGSTSIVNDYTLSGELNVGENTITASYGGKTTTVTVTVAVASGTYELSVETSENTQYQYYCPIFNVPITNSLRVVFTRDFETYGSGKGSVATWDVEPTQFKNGAKILDGGLDYSAEYVDISIDISTAKPYWGFSISTKALTELTLKNFHCYVDGVEVEPVKWLGLGSNTVTVVKLA